VLVAGGVLVLAVAVVGYLLTSGIFDEPEAATGALVAAVDIAPGTVVAGSDFTFVEADLGAVPHVPWSPEAPSLFEGLVSVGRIAAGMPVVEAMFRTLQSAPFEDELEVTVELDLSATPSEVVEGDLVLLVDPGAPPTVEDEGRPRAVIAALELQQFDGSATRLFVQPEEWVFWSNLAVDLGAAPQVLPVPLGGDAEEMTARLNEAWQADHAAELALFAAAAAELEAAAVEPAPRPGELEVLLELDLSLSPTPPAEGDLVLIVDPGVPPAVGDAGRPRRVVQPLELTDFDGATARLFAPPEEWRRWSALPFDLGASPLALPVEPGTDAGATADSLNALWQEEYDRALARAEAEALEISAELARARPGPGQLAVTVLLDGTLSSTPLQQGDLVLLIDPGSAPVPGDAGRPRRVIGPLELGDFDGISVRMFVPPDEWLRWRSLPGELGGAPMAIPVPPGSDVEEMTAALDAAWRAEHESATADLDAPADGQFWVSLPVVLANPGVAPREGDIVFLVDPGSPAEVDDEGNVTSPRIPPNVIEWRPLEGWDGLALNFWADADRYAYYTYLRDRLDGRAVVALPVVAGELTSGRLDALLAELDRALGRWSP